LADVRKAVLHAGVREYLVKNTSMPLEIFDLGDGGKTKTAKPAKPKPKPIKPKPVSPSTPSNLAGYRQAGVIYFESPGCSGCDRAEKQLRYFHRKYPGVIVFKVNALEPKGRIMQMAVATRLNLPKAKSLLTPMFASGTAAYAKDEATDDNLATLFANVLGNPFWREWDETTELAQAETALKTMSKEMTLGLVLAGGLIDGINPCAFAVVVFLISCLGLGGGQGRRYALVFGGLFCAGVFCCYLLLGMGLTSLLEHLQGFKGAFRILTYGMAVLCLVFAIACFRDAWRARLHGASAMEFGIPKSVTKIIHRLIRNNVGRSLLSLSAFGLGILVSALELVCTGQVYLPVLAFINAAEPGGRSIGLLLAYNVAFILPLVVVTLIGIFGAGATPLVHWGRKHAATAKAMTGFVLLGIGGALVLIG
jgi:cytochrome c biogenesis protein CcdA